MVLLGVSRYGWLVVVAALPARHIAVLKARRKGDDVEQARKRSGAVKLSSIPIAADLCESAYAREPTREGRAERCKLGDREEPRIKNKCARVAASVSEGFAHYAELTHLLRSLYYQLSLTALYYSWGFPANLHQFSASSELFSYDGTIINQELYG